MTKLLNLTALAGLALLAVPTAAVAAPLVDLSGPPSGSSAFDPSQYTEDSIEGAVPEPATWAMMISGFGLVGTALRRRQLLDSPA